MSALERNKHLILLVAIVLMNLAQPLVHGLVQRLILYDIGFNFVVLGIFLVVFRMGWQRVVAVAIGLPAIVSQWAAYGLMGESRTVAWEVHHGFMLMFLSFAVAVILRGIFSEERIETDHVIGTVCGYLLAGAAWGNAYWLAEQFAPHSFDVKTHLAWQLDRGHSASFLFDYFSFCTLTSVGFGDMAPVGPVVSSLAWMEALFGKFYIAVVVAQLVGLKLAQAKQH